MIRIKVTQRLVLPRFCFIVTLPASIVVKYRTVRWPFNVASRIEAGPTKFRLYYGAVE